MPRYVTTVVSGGVPAAPSWISGLPVWAWLVLALLLVIGIGLIVLAFRGGKESDVIPASEDPTVQDRLLTVAGSQPETADPSARVADESVTPEQQAQDETADLTDDVDPSHVVSPDEHEPGPTADDRDDHDTLVTPVVTVPAGEPAAEDPAAHLDEPVAEEPAAHPDEPAADELASDEPAVDEPAAEDTNEADASHHETVADETVADETVADEAAALESAWNWYDTDQVQQVTEQRPAPEGASEQVADADLPLEPVSEDTWTDAEEPVEPDADTETVADAALLAEPIADDTIEPEVPDEAETEAEPVAEDSTEPEAEPITERAIERDTEAEVEAITEQETPEALDTAPAALPVVAAAAAAEPVDTEEAAPADTEVSPADDDSTQTTRVSRAANREAVMPEEEPLTVLTRIPAIPLNHVERGYLAQAEEYLGWDETPGVALVGPIGSGTSTVAGQLARRAVESGRLVVAWISAMSPETIVLGLAELAEQIGVADPGGDSVVSAHRLRQHLEQSTTEGLIVFDGATEPLLLAEFTPQRGATKVVATSANEDLTNFWPVVRVQPFDDDTAKGYLEARISRGNDKSAQAVADAVGHNPLALAIASRHLRKRPWTSVDGYAATLKGRGYASRLLGRSGRLQASGLTEGILRTVAAAEDDDPGLRPLMGLIAALAPSPVPISDLAIILGTGTELDDESRLSLDLAIDLALITPTTDGRGLVMHESVAQVLRDRSWPTGEDGGWVAHTAHRVAQLLPPIEQAKERRVETITRIIQLRNLWDLGVQVCIKVPNGCPQIVLELLEEPMARATRHLLAAGDLRLAQEITEVVTGDIAQVLGESHPSIAAFRRHLAGSADERTVASAAHTELAPA